MGRILSTLCALTLILAIFSTPALAWGQEGHEAVCEIAFQLLNHKAQKAVTRILSSDPKPEFKVFR